MEGGGDSVEVWSVEGARRAVARYLASGSVCVRVVVMAVDSVERAQKMAEILLVMADGGCEIINGNKLLCVVNIAGAIKKYLAVTQDLTDPAKPRDIKAESKKQLVTAYRQLAALPMPVGRCRLKDRRLRPPSFIPGTLGRAVVVKRMRKKGKGKKNGRKKNKIKGSSKIKSKGGKRKRRSSKSYPFAPVVHHLVKRMGSLSKKIWYPRFMNKLLSKILFSVTFDIHALMTRRVVFAPRKANVKK